LEKVYKYKSLQKYNLKIFVYLIGSMPWYRKLWFDSERRVASKHTKACRIWQFRTKLCST